MKPSILAPGVLLVVCILLATASIASTIVRQIEFANPEIDRRGDASIVSVKDCPEFAEPGEPLLPSYPLRVLLPQGERVVGVEAQAFEEAEILLGAPVEWGQPQALKSMLDAWERVMPDPVIYGSQDPFPATRVVHVTTQTFRGYNIAFFRVYPATYVGMGNRLIYAPRIEVTIETDPSIEALRRSRGTLRHGFEKDVEELALAVDDITAADSYGSRDAAAPPLDFVDPADTYPYVIITTATLQPVFEVLKAHKDSRGLLTKMVRIADVVWNYEGLDLADRIRKFIRDAYLYWGTEYVLLGGDDEIIPHRGLYAEILPYVTDKDIPADIYFATLDGTWNDDMDQRWGEPGEDDLMPEVSVARASVNTVTEATNFVNKVIRYETAPVVSQIKVAQMAGELVYNEPTWGGDEKDEIKDGSSAHGFTTAGFPPSFTVHTLYDRDLYPAEWSKYDLIALMNSGRHLINHAGHCINWMCMKISTSDIPTSFTNDGITNSYLVIYAHGCYSAAFDGRTTDGSYVGDAVAEYFTFIENGAVAYIGNSRYGCGFHGDTRSAAQYYDRQFFDALFGEGITAIGDTQNDSKIDNIPYIDFRGMRWTYYTLTLIGEPSMDIWTDTPGYLTVTVPDAFYVGENEVEIAVSGSGPVEGARVTILGDSTYSSHGYTDATGRVYLDPGADPPGSLYVAVTAHNFYSHLDTVPVITSAGPLLMLDDTTIDDDTSGASWGDSDGEVDAGETIECTVSLRNVGQATAESISGTLRTSDPNVIVTDSTGTFANIPSDGVLSPAWSYVYGVSSAASDSHLISFNLDLSYSDTSVVRHFSSLISAPDLSIVGLSFGDSLYGDGDGCIESGEDIELVLTLANYGSGDAADVSVTLSEDDPYAALLAGSTFLPGITSGQVLDTSPAYVISIEPDCPKFRRIDLDVAIELANGRVRADSTAVYIGGLVEDDFETAAMAWTHAVIIPGFVDQWHLEDYRNHTPGGTYCWKFGGAGADRYAHYAHGALVTPELCLGPNATLTFWHWIQVELETGNYASDGAIIEISTDGGRTWSQITPVGGYPHRIYPGTSTPIPPETPCFAWTDVWAQVEFDLSAYGGRARVRFNFGGGENFGAEEGWYVDDIIVTDDYASVRVDDDLAVIPTEFALHSVGPNPVSSGVTVVFDIPYRSRASVEAFDIAGRKLATIDESTFEPGRHSRTWKIDHNTAPGIYFVRLKTPGFNQTKKVVIY